MIQSFLFDVMPFFQKSLAVSSHHAVTAGWLPIIQHLVHSAPRRQQLVVTANGNPAIDEGLIKPSPFQEQADGATRNVRIGS